MDRELHIVYHCFCKNNWASIVDEHFGYIKNAIVHCTSIGSPRQINELEMLAQAHGITLKLEAHEDAEIYEHAAMAIVERLAKSYPNDFILYFHTKGAGRPVEVSDNWRQYMNQHFIARYREHFKKLKKSGKDATGVLYVRKEKDRDFDGLTTQFFAGNFWMASNEYLNRLPKYEALKKKYPNSWLTAERYIGWCDPKVKYIKQFRTMKMTGLFGFYRKIVRL